MNIKSIVTEALDNMLTDPLNVQHTHARSKVHTEEKPYNSTDLIDLHMQAHENDVEIPDEPMKFGDVFHHHATKAHANVFFTDHHDISKLPHYAQTAIRPKLNAGYQIHKMVHVYTPYGGVTYAHMSQPDGRNNNLHRYLHEPE